MLHGAVRKPSVFSSDCPAVLYGFINLISVFESLTPEFYSWNSCDTIDSLDSYALSTMYQSVSAFLPLLPEISEIQQVDIVVTQQWLLARLWKFWRDRSPQRRLKSSELLPLPLQVPVAAGKVVMNFLSSVSHESRDAHGIGMVSFVFVFFHVTYALSCICQHIQPGSLFFFLLFFWEKKI